MSIKQWVFTLFLGLPLFGIAQKKKLVIKDSTRYSLSMIYESLIDISYVYDEYVELSVLGFSEFEQSIPILKLSNEKTEEKKNILIVGNLHAREFFSSKFVLKFCNEFLYSLDSDKGIYPSARELLGKYNIYVIPVANPDGLKIAQEDWKGIESHKSSIDSIKRIGPFSDWKANGKGIDLNNNFDDGNFEVKQGHLFEEKPASQGHKGAFPCQAIEAKIIQDFVDSIVPLLTLSFHTKGDVLFWADRGTHAQFKGLDTKINTIVAETCGFILARVSRNPKEYGAGLENYIRAKTKRIGVCVELSVPNGTTAQHPPNKFNSLVWQKCKNMPILYLQELARLYPLYSSIFKE